MASLRTEDVNGHKMFVVACPICNKPLEYVSRIVPDLELSVKCRNCNKAAPFHLDSQALVKIK